MFEYRPARPSRILLASAGTPALALVLALLMPAAFCFAAKPKTPGGASGKKTAASTANTSGTATLSPEQLQDALFPNAAKSRAVLGAETAATPAALPQNEKQVSPDSILLNSFSYHYHNGLKLRKLQETARAAEELEKALTLDPAHLDCRLEYGDCLLLTGRVSEALEQFQEAARRHPVDTAPWVRIGDLHLQGKKPGRLNLARAAYEKALTLEPNSVPLLIKLALLEREAGNPAEAIREFEKILAIQPSNLEANLYLGLLIKAQGTDPVRALKHLKRYLELKNDKDSAVEALVKALGKEIEQTQTAKTPKPH